MEILNKSKDGWSLFQRVYKSRCKTEIAIIKAKLKRATLVFNVCGGRVSYNQIRKILTK